MKKVMVFGCQRVAIDVIDFLNKQNDANLVGVVTHDEERDKLFSNQSVAEFCDSKGIHNFRYGKKIEVDPIAKLDPDIIFSIYYRRILPYSIIDYPDMGCINLHPAVLPKDRGPNPTYWQVRRGEKWAGTTLHYIDGGMDTGDIIAQTESISTYKTTTDRMTGFELNDYMMGCGFRLFKNNYNNIISGTNMYLQQENYKATCNISFSNNMRYIDWCSCVCDIESHILAHAKPYAGSVAWNNKVKIIIHKAIRDYGSARGSRGPGSYEYDNGRLVVQTHDYPLLVLDFDYEFGKLKNAGRFRSGCPEVV